MAMRNSSSSSTFSELVLSDDQREIVELFGRLGSERLGVSPVPLRGFMWKAVREWQQRNQTSVDVLNASSPEVRLRAAQEIMALVLERVLSTFPEKRHEEVRGFVDEVLDVYREGFNRR